MTEYSITVTEAELDVVRLALGRMVNPRKVPAKRAPGATRVPSMGKPPKLSDGARITVASQWRGAIADPERWRYKLAYAAASNTGRRNVDEVFRAWGLAVPERG